MAVCGREAGEVAVYRGKGGEVVVYGREAGEVLIYGREGGEVVVCGREAGVTRGGAEGGGVESVRLGRQPVLCEAAAGGGDTPGGRARDRVIPRHWNPPLPHPAHLLLRPSSSASGRRPCATCTWISHTIDALHAMCNVQVFFQ